MLLFLIESYHVWKIFPKYFGLQHSLHSFMPRRRVGVKIHTLKRGILYKRPLTHPSTEKHRVLYPQHKDINKTLLYLLRHSGQNKN